MTYDPFGEVKQCAVSLLVFGSGTTFAMLSLHALAPGRQLDPKVALNQSRTSGMAPSSAASLLSALLRNPDRT